MKKRFTEEQIIGFLREAEARLPIRNCELARLDSYYLWCSKFSGMSVSDTKRQSSKPRTPD